jgi:nitrite reductase/ring-hydroxylating ferredoxin subunit
MSAEDIRKDPPGSPASGCPFHRWQEDFPINWEADHYVTRRELTKFLTLGSCLLAGANALIALVGVAERGEPLPEKSITRASVVPAGGSLLFRYPTDADPCILVRDPSGALRAYSQVCTHLACAVVHRPDENVLFCPCHHGVFDLREGRPMAGPPTRRLPRIKLEQRGGEIFAVGVEV